MTPAGSVIRQLIGAGPVDPAEVLAVLADDRLVDQLAVGELPADADPAAIALARWVADIRRGEPRIALPLPRTPALEYPAMPSSGSTPGPTACSGVSHPQQAPERTPSGRYRTVFGVPGQPRPARGGRIDHQALGNPWPPLLCRLGWHRWDSRSVMSVRPADRGPGDPPRALCTLVSRCARRRCDIVRHEQNVPAPRRHQVPR